jgi:uncharacterized protein (DUF2336 family)
MTTSFGHLTKLVELAQERSSEKRRELLRDMSELFLDSEDIRADDNARGVADDILTTLAREMEAGVKAELAEQFADHPDAPAELVNDLAKDVIEVARPLLERSQVVRQETLAETVRLHGASHARVVAGRDDVGEVVSEAIAETHDDEALVRLAHNENAQLSRMAMEHLVDHAENCEELHAPIVERNDVAPDLLNEMFFLVKKTLRDRILEKTSDIPPEQIEAAFAAAQARLARKSGAPPRDLEEAVKFVNAKKLRKKLNTDLLSELLLAGEQTKFLVAFADMTGLSYNAARRTLSSPSIDPLLVACRCVGFSRDDFVRIAMLRSTSQERGEADATVLGDIYDAVPIATAERVMRFVKLRKSTQDAA